mgnify:CR=1 FL=1
MPKTLNAVNVFAIVLGIFLTIEGALGLFNPMLFGLFSTNPLHAVIHLMLGVSGIYAGLRNHARNFSYFTGFLLLVVGLLFFVPAIEPLQVKLFNLNRPVAVFNIIVGIVVLLFAMLTPKRPVPGSH